MQYTITVDELTQNVTEVKADGFTPVLMGTTVEDVMGETVISDAMRFNEEYPKGTVIQCDECQQHWRRTIDWSGNNWVKAEG